MPSYVAASLLVFLGAVGAAMALTRRGHGRDDSLQRAFLWLGFALLSMQVLEAVVKESRAPWCNARLAPAAGWLRGYPIYSRRHDGPVTGFIYGPLGELAYVPAVAWGDRPSHMLLMGCALSFLYCAAPAVFLILCYARRTAARASGPGLTAVLVFLVATGLSPSLARSVYMVHADAPALGLAAGALMVWMLARDPESSLALGLASGLAVAACFAKQVLVFAPLGVVVLAALSAGWRAGLKAAGFVLLWLALALVGVARLGSWRDFVFNAITIPARHPWITENPQEPASFAHRLGAVALATFIDNDISLVVFGGLLFVLATAYQAVRERPAGSRLNFRNWTQERWFPALVFAALALPAGVVGRAKVGGDINAYSFPAYFLALSLALLLVDFLARPFARPWEACKTWVRVALVVAAAGLLFVRGPQATRTLYLARDMPNTSDQVYDYALRHPGLVYFPWHPLPVLLAEGRLDHFAYGVVDRDLAGFPVAPAEFRACLPPEFQAVALPDVPLPTLPYFLTTHLKNVLAPRPWPEMPGFLALSRSGADLRRSR